MTHDTPDTTSHINVGCSETNSNTCCVGGYSDSCNTMVEFRPLLTGPVDKSDEYPSKSPHVSMRRPDVHLSGSFTLVLGDGRALLTEAVV